MSPDDDVSLLVEFKLWLVRALEDHLLRELAAAASSQGRRLPAVTRNLLRTGATTAVSALAPSDLGRFAQGDSWADAFQAAVVSGAWEDLVEETLRHSFAPESS